MKELQIEYPKAHPHAKELSELRAQADLLYKEIEESETNARTAYKHAMESLVQMGTQRLKSHEKLKELAGIMREIEDLAVKPFI